jgi:tetratricopeptide (TPR) repeat protein
VDDMRDYASAGVHYAMGDAWLQSGQATEAEAAYKRAVEGYAATLPAGSPALGTARLMWARSLHQLGRWPQAHALLDTVFEAARGDASQQPGNVADRAHLAAGFMALDEGAPLPVLEAARAVAARLAKLGPSPALRAGLLVAELQAAAGQHAAAASTLQGLQPLLGKALPTGSLAQRQALAAWGDVQRLGGDAVAAEQAYRQALGPLRDATLEVLPAAQLALARAHLGMAQMLMPTAAVQARQHAAQALQTLPADSPVRRAQTLRKQAQALLDAK